MSALFLLGITAANGQSNCQNCTNLTPTGDMMQINSSGSGGLNAMNIDWHSSHGSPSYGPGYLWTWSYNGNGEGVYYDGFTFLAGHTYCITFDGYTRTHNNTPAVADAGFRVVATNSMTPMESPSGGDPIPAIPIPSDIVADVPWSTTPMNAWSTYSYTFTPTSNWSQLWFYPHASALPQVELTLQNLRICDITIPNPCDFDLGIQPQMLVGGCGIQFNPYVTMASGLQVIQYLWDFGDGTTSTLPNPIHYYSSAGSYVVKLTVLVINANGECCARTVYQDIAADKCNPCEIINGLTVHNPGYSGGLTSTFTTFGPSSPNYVYLWDFGDGNTATGQTVSHTYASPGVYVVSVKIYYFDADNGVCCSAETKRSVEIYNTVAPVDGAKSTAASAVPTVPHADVPENLKERPVENNNSGSINVFPNPSSGSFTVSSDQVIRSVEISDAQGRLIQTVKAGKTSVAVSIQAQKPGTYTLNILMENGSKQTQTIVKN